MKKVQIALLILCLGSMFSSAAQNVEDKKPRWSFMASLSSGILSGASFTPICADGAFCRNISRLKIGLMGTYEFNNLYTKTFPRFGSGVQNNHVFAPPGSGTTKIYPNAGCLGIGIVASFDITDHLWLSASGTFGYAGVVDFDTVRTGGGGLFSLTLPNYQDRWYNTTFYNAKVDVGWNFDVSARMKLAPTLGFKVTQVQGFDSFTNFMFGARLTGLVGR